MGEPVWDGAWQDGTGQSSTALPAPPADVVAEQALLGGILDAAAGGQAAAAARMVKTLLAPGACPPAAFWNWRNEALAQRLLAMVEAGHPVDPVTLNLELTKAGEITRLGPSYLHDLMQAGYFGNAERYATHLRQLWMRRRLMARNVRALQLLAGQHSDDGFPLALAEMGAALDEAEDSTRSAMPIVPRTVGDLLADTNDEPDWLLLGLLARLERIMLTGQEGLGKTELLIQLAVCAALGLDPFAGRVTSAPVRVLHVDVENERADMRPRYRRMVRVAEAYAQTELDRDRLMFEDRTDGLELALPGSDDLAWLDRLMSAARPDLLVIGPVYKLTNEDIEKTGPAKALTANLDRLRVRHQCTLLIEAHQGNASDTVSGARIMRPQGSSIFRRWPNVGIGLRAHWTVADTDERPWLAEVVRWRGFRMARGWPKAVRMGRGPGALPWVGVDEMELRATEEDARAKSKPRRPNTRKAG